MQRWELCTVTFEWVLFHHPENGYQELHHKTFTVKPKASSYDTICKLLAESWEPFGADGSQQSYYFRRLVS